MYNIGPKESQAVSNLMTNISEKAVRFITDSVRARGMLKYISHDILGRNLLNRNFTSGVAAHEAWKNEFRNKDDDILASCRLFDFSTCQ